MTRRWALSALAVLSALAPLAASVPSALAVDPAACGDGSPAYIPQTPSAFSSLALERAWTISKGKSVVVAVVDSGVDPSDNPHLEGVVLAGTDLVDGRGDGREDDYWHGTEVAGIIAARKVNGSGLVGIAPEAKILPVRVYSGSCDSKAPEIDPAKLADGIEWAADANPHPQIIVVAASMPFSTPRLEQAVRHASERGSLVVAAAGNADDPGVPDDRIQDRYPASIDGVLSVTAVDQEGRPSANVVMNVFIDIAAPGQAVTTTRPGGRDIVVSQDKASSSYATAYVAGAAALVAAAFPEETPAQWADRLLTTASRPKPLQSPTDLQKVGWGIVAPYNALNIEDVAAVPGPKNSTQPPAQALTPPNASPPQPATGSLFTIIGPIAGVTAIALIAISLLKARRAVG